MSQKKIIIELQYLAPVSVFSQIARSEEVIIETFEHYQKGSYRNRCHIMGANGLLPLSIPLEKGKHQQTPITEVRINYANNWRTQHWQSIKSAYGRSPFWEFYGDYFDPIYQKKYDFLFDFNCDLFKTTCKLLKINTTISFSPSYEKKYEEEEMIDLRNQILPSKTSEMPKYPQIFEDRFGFTPDLSIIDLLFCMGNQGQKFF